MRAWVVNRMIKFVQSGSASYHFLEKILQSVRFPVVLKEDREDRCY